MSESQTNMEARLKTLQCHFTWEELAQEIKPWVVRDDLEDIGTDEGNCWLPHIYNLLGYLHRRLGSDEEALRFLNLATEELERRHDTEEGPWMMVNSGNLAWLHHLMGHQSESERYLSKVEDLRSQHPNVSQDDLHAEVTAEKAWTLMTLVDNHLKKVEELFLAAIEREPERVEWKTSLALALVRAQKHELPLTDDVRQRLERARQEDPENVYIAIKHLQHGRKEGIDIRVKAREMAELVLRNPVSSYSGLKAILRVYREFLSIDDAVELAEEALREHPDERFLKRCAALCYYWKITNCNRKRIYVQRATMNRAINLHQEVIALYPDTCLVKEINLAAIQGCRDPEVGDEKYQELLARDLDDLDKQMLFNHYAKFLFFTRKEYRRSVEYHMKAAEMKPQSFFRDNSIKFLRERFQRNSNLCTEIEDFLKNLPIDES